MSAPSVKEFYAAGHRGTPFGVVDKLHPKGHSGADFNGWPAGTRIPAFAAGKVVAKGNSKSNFGYWVTVDIGGGYFAHYCHEESAGGGPEIGAPVVIGTDMGPLGSTGYSSGNHLHAMVTRASNPDRYFGVTDPMPWINAALAGGGSGGGGVPSAQPRKDKKMIQLRVPNGTIANIGELTWRVYASTTQAFSYGLNAKIWGTVEVTPDEMTTALREVAEARKEFLAALYAGLPAAGGGGLPADFLQQILDGVDARLADDFAKIEAADPLAIAEAVADEQAERLKS